MLTWNNRGLIPAIVQDAATGTTLMLAWMNSEALDRTRETGFVHFYSRSRATLWKKGESSGNTLKVKELRAENRELKEVVAEVTLKNRVLKKSLTGLREEDAT